MPAKKGKSSAKTAKKLVRTVRKQAKKSAKKDTRLNHLTNPYFQVGTEEARTKIAGNDFYKLRSKHGRDKIFESAEVMLQAFDEYREAKKNNPWHKLEKLGKRMVEVPTIMPLTWDSFCIFCDVAPSYFVNFKKNLHEDGQFPLKLTDRQRQDFIRAIEIIDRIIRDQKYNGAATGYFKENIISYDLGIRKDVEPENTATSTTIIVRDDEDKKLIEDIRKKLKE